MNTSKDTSALTGLPGRVMIGMLPPLGVGIRPQPCGIPGCMATLTNSTLGLRLSASLTTSYAPALTPPEVMMRSASSATSSRRARKSSTSSGTKCRCRAIAPAAVTAAVSIAPLDS